MEEFFVNQLGVSANTLNYLILPLLIFLARILDVSLSTIRIIFVMNGNRFIAPLLGFFEALIWLLAIGQIISNIDNVWSYVAYAAGFATGTFVGMTIEQKLAYGMVVVRLITAKPVGELVLFLEENGYRYSIIDAEGRTGKVNVVFLVVKRSDLPHLLKGIDYTHPNAFYTIEGVKKVQTGFDQEERSDSFLKKFGLRFIQKGNK